MEIYDVAKRQAFPFSAAIRIRSLQLCTSSSALFSELHYRGYGKILHRNVFRSLDVIYATEWYQCRSLCLMTRIPLICFVQVFRLSKLLSGETSQKLLSGLTTKRS
jgi:hypothetical protein